MALILRVSCTLDVGCDVQATTLIRGPQLLTPFSTLFLIYLNPTNYAITMRGKGNDIRSWWSEGGVGACRPWEAPITQPHKLPSPDSTSL
jgi:hypothetical protein